MPPEKLELTGTQAAGKISRRCGVVVHYKTLEYRISPSILERVPNESPEMVPPYKGDPIDDGHVNALRPDGSTLL